MVLLDAESLEERQSLLLLGDRIGQIEYAADGRTLLVVADRPAARTFTVWDTSDGSRRFVFDDEEDIVAADFSPDGSLIASINEHGDVRLRDAQTGELRVTFDAHGSRDTPISGKGLQFTGDGSRLLTRGSEIAQMIRIWDVSQLLEKKKADPAGEEAPLVRVAGRATSEMDASTHDVVFGPDGTWFFATFSEEPGGVFATATGTRLLEIPESNDLKSVAVSPSGEFLAATDHDDKFGQSQSVIVWNRNDGSEAWRAPNVVNPAIAFIDDSRLLVRVETGLAQNHLEIWSETGPTPMPDDDYVLDGAAGRVASIDRNGDVRLWSFNGDEPQHTVLSVEDHPADELQFSTDGRFLAAASSEHIRGLEESHLFVWNVETGKRILSKPYPGDLSDLIPLPEQNRIVVSGYGHPYGQTALIDLETGDVLLQMQSLSADVATFVTSTPDGRVLAADNYSLGLNAEGVVLYEFDDILNQDWTSAAATMANLGITIRPDAGRFDITLKGPLFDADLKGLASVPCPFRLSIHKNCQLESGLKPLTGLSGLEELSINLPDVGDESVPVLDSLSSLRKLDSRGSNLSDEALENLRNNGVEVLN